MAYVDPTLTQTAHPAGSAQSYRTAALPPLVARLSVPPHLAAAPATDENALRTTPAAQQRIRLATPRNAAVPDTETIEHQEDAPRQSADTPETGPAIAIETTAEGAPAQPVSAPADAQAVETPPVSAPTKLDFGQSRMLRMANLPPPPMPQAEVRGQVQELSLENSVFFRIKVDHTGKVLSIGYIHSGGDSFQDALLAAEVLKKTYLTTPPLAPGETAYIELVLPYPGSAAHTASAPDLQSLLP